MSRRSTFYGFIAAATATAVSGLIYRSATSSLAALGDVGEGTPQEIRSAVNTKDLWLLLLFVMGMLTVILFTRFITLKRRDDKQVST
jgi:hypothetical protein